MVFPRSVLFAVVLVLFAACHAAPGSGGPPVPTWTPCAAVPGAPSLRGLAVVDAATAWVSGAAGTIARTTDGGASWQRVGPADAAACDFRDIAAFDADTAVAMVAGQPARVYRTTDGGASWQIVLADERKAAFFDGLAFAGPVGVLVGDPVDGAACVWTSRDAGASWTPVPREQLPQPLAGEACFAASGTCVAVAGVPGAPRFVVATGGAARARVWTGTADGWRAVDVPLAAGRASQGGFGLAVRGERVVLVGGDYAAPTAAAATAAGSDDGAGTWSALPAGVGGFRSAVAWLDDEHLVAVGSHGTTWLGERGRRVDALTGDGFHCLATVAAADHVQVWAAGADGRVATCTWQPPAPFALAALFGDHMVLPPATTVMVRGRGPRGMPVAVQASWGAAAHGTVDADGRWSLPLATPAHGGPHTVTLRCGATTRTLHDVLVGDVWLASGQSNMEMALGKHGWSGGVRDHERELAAADLPQLRVFTVAQAAREAPADDVEGEWVVCSPATAGRFSATAYLFARDLVAAGKTPLGLVVSAWGGTVAEAWVRETGLASFPEFAGELAAQRAAGKGSRDQRVSAFWRDVAARPGQPARAVEVPELWGQGPLRDFDGVVRYTRTFELPAALRGRDAWLELGAIDDFDEVSWNGTRLGGLAAGAAWTTPRRYRVPKALTDAATVTLRVDVLDTGGEGGFAGPAGVMRLVADGAAGAPLPLAGTWQRAVVGGIGELPRWPSVGGPNRPAVLWNGMVAPLLPFPFTGAIWYQGESNRERAAQYARLFPALIEDWRAAIGTALPFYFVQIAPYGYGGDRGETALLREAQAAALQLPRTGMAVTLDCGDARDIHPIDKQPVGARLAALALARHYGGGDGGEGPVLREAVRADDGSVRLAFANTAGLALANGGAGFELAGADGVFVRTPAALVGAHVVLQAPAGMAPTQVRYAWAAVPEWSLRNAAQPAAPFRASIR